MAGIGFDGKPQNDSKIAAKNVQCIHTSYIVGTVERNCHQDWLLGYCGMNQKAARDVESMVCFISKEFCMADPISSHSLCPHFYTSAFKNNFTVDNYYRCDSKRLLTNLPTNFKMGYMETRKK